MRRMILTAAAAAISLSSPALAASQNAEVAVDYNDLDLSKAAHVEVLEERVRQAAREVCNVATASDRACVRKTVKAAMAEVEQRTPAVLASR